MKIAFYISGKASRLVKFVKQADMSLLSQIEVIVSDAVVPADTRAVFEDAKLTIVEFHYDQLAGETRKKKNLSLSDAILQTLEKRGVDYCISFGSHILCGDLLQRYQWRLINFHPAILPQFPGVRAIDQAIAHGNVFLVGNTVHFIDAGVDTGRIIMQSVIPLRAFTEANNDYDVILDLQVNMLNKLMHILRDHRLCICDGNVIIEGADYSCGECFPKIV